jgi:Flp pilus assembly pilin Flp
VSRRGHPGLLARRFVATVRFVGSVIAGARQPAQEVVEYGIIIATIAVVVLLGTTAFGSQIRPWFEQLAGRITTVGT